MNGGRRVIVALGAAGCIAWSATASASADRIAQMRVVGVSRAARMALSPRARLQPFTFYGGLRQTMLLASPATVTIGDVDYRMRVAVDDVPASFGMDEQDSLDINLERQQDAAVGRAVQEYDYSYSPDAPFAFSYDHAGLTTASVDTGSTISPDALAATFTATGSIDSASCRINRAGQRGTIRTVPGDFSYSRFSIDTTSSPFFGVLTQGPQHGILRTDPGCGFTDSGFNPKRRPCVAHEMVDAESGNTSLFAVANYRRTRGFQAAFGTTRSSGNFARFGFGFIESAIAATDLPPPKHSMHGATAQVRTTGDPFMSGAATFRSGRAPHVSRVHRCFAFGGWHRYRELTYRGRIDQHSDPLTARFDTGSVASPPFAKLALWRYLS